MPEHRWSGWPGAICLNCRCEDPMEIALADNWMDVGPNPDGSPYEKWEDEKREAIVKYLYDHCSVGASPAEAEDIGHYWGLLRTEQGVDMEKRKRRSNDVHISGAGMVIEDE